MTTYISGTLVRTTATFKDITGTLADPDAATVKYKAGSASTQTPAATKDSTGVYHYDIDTSGFTGPGTLTYTVEWAGTGAVQAVSSSTFTVEPAAL